MGPNIGAKLKSNDATIESNAETREESRMDPIYEAQPMIFGPRGPTRSSVNGYAIPPWDYAIVGGRGTAPSPHVREYESQTDNFAAYMSDVNSDATVEERVLSV